MDVLFTGLKSIELVKFSYLLSRPKSKHAPSLFSPIICHSLPFGKLTVQIGGRTLICESCKNRLIDFHGIDPDYSIFYIGRLVTPLVELKKVIVESTDQRTFDYVIPIIFLRISSCINCVILRNKVKLECWDFICSPNVWLNITQGQKYLEPANITFQDTEQPELASQIQIALIRSPNYEEKINVDQQLIQYFEKYRLLTVKDTFSVEKKGQEYFFKVMQIDNNQSQTHFYVQNARSSLVQVPSIKSSLPHVPKVGSTHVKQFAMFHVAQIMSNYAAYNKLKLHHLRENSRPFCVLLDGVSGCGKAHLARNIASMLYLGAIQINAYELMSETSGASEARIRQLFDRVSSNLPCAVIIRNIEVMFMDSTANNIDTRALATWNNCMSSGLNDECIFVATTADVESIHSQFIATFNMHIQFQALNVSERSEILQVFSPQISHDICYQIAQLTAGFVISDMINLTHEAKYLSKCNNMQLSDLMNALDLIKSTHSTSIGAPTVPNVNWNDVGGLENAKREIVDTILMPRKHANLFHNNNLKRSGVLLHGPPGCGKTLLAKAVATECKLTFLSVKGPELLNMYVGQSEKNVRMLFSRARSCSPCVIFMDELDSLAPNRGIHGDSGGVMDRIVSQLLSELDGIDVGGEVYVMGATNRPDLIDPALLRPGRFDKLVYVGLSNDPHAILQVLKAQTKNVPLANDVDLQYLAQVCPKDLSGADIYSWVSEACSKSIEENIEMIDSGMSIDGQFKMVEMQHFMQCLNQVETSVEPSEMQRYDAMANNL